MNAFWWFFGVAFVSYWIGFVFGSYRGYANGCAQTHDIYRGAPR